jgi:hypothetical protein
MYSWYEAIPVGRVKVTSSYRVMPAHYIPWCLKRESTGTASLILNFGTRWSGQFPALAALLQEKEPLVPTEQEAGWVPELAWMFWRRERTLTPAANQTLDHPACDPVTMLTTLFQLLGYISPGAIPHVGLCLGLPTCVYYLEVLWQ